MHNYAAFCHYAPCCTVGLNWIGPLQLGLAKLHRGEHCNRKKTAQSELIAVARRVGGGMGALLNNMPRVGCRSNVICRPHLLRTWMVEQQRGKQGSI